ncbi:MAG: hypothetical protein M1823_008109, partial [Watsoniomyces obsoletus]
TAPLAGRKVRWWEALSGYQLDLVHQAGKNNPADAPSGRPDYHPGDEATEPPQLLLSSPQGQSPTGQGSEGSGKRRRRRKRDRREIVGKDLSTLLAGTGICRPLVPRHIVAAAMIGETAYAECSRGVRELVAEMLPHDPLARDVRDVLSRDPPDAAARGPHQAGGDDATSSRDKHFREKWKMDEGLLFHEGKL